MSFHAVGIKHGNYPEFFYSPVFAEFIQEFCSCSIHIVFRKFLEFRPSKDDIIAVHQQVFFSGFFLPGSVGRGLCIVSGSRSGFVPDSFFT